MRLHDGCPSGQTMCSGTCTNVNGDSQNCGACGHACTGGTVCVAGTCEVECPSGQIVCGGNCVTTSTDPGNCGACGAVCPSGQACISGTCTTECPAGQTVCSGACVSLSKDPCELRGVRRCVPQRPGVCVRDLHDGVPRGTDRLRWRLRQHGERRSNCGACGNACPSGQVCASGNCATSCQAGETELRRLRASSSRRTQRTAAPAARCAQAGRHASRELHDELPGRSDRVLRCLRDLTDDASELWQLWTRVRERKGVLLGQLHDVMPAGQSVCSGVCVNCRRTRTTAAGAAPCALPVTYASAAPACSPAKRGSPTAAEPA